MFLTISGEFGRYWNNTKLVWKGLVIKLQGGVYTDNRKFIIVPKRFLTKYSNLRIRNIQIISRLKNRLTVLVSTSIAG